MLGDYEEILKATDNAGKANKHCKNPGHFWVILGQMDEAFSVSGPLGSLSHAQVA